MEVRMIYWALNSLFVFSSFLLFKLAGISTRRAILAPLDSLSTLAGGVLTDAVTIMYNILVMLIQFSVPLLPLILAMCVLTIYGVLFKEDRKPAVVSSALGCAAGIALVGLTPTSIFYSLGIVASSALLTGLAHTVYKELDMWKGFRTGSHVVGKGLLIVNIALAVGVAISVVANFQSYEAEYKEQTKQTLVKVVAPENMTDAEILARLPPTYRSQYEQLNAIQKQRFLDAYRQQLAETANETTGQILDSGGLGSLFTITVATSPLVIFGILETLRTLVFTQIAGLVTKVALNTRRN